MKKNLLFTLSAILASLLSVGALAQTPVFINEIHYDNSGSDVNEGVEVAGPAGTDLTGWTLVFYNGNGGASYATENLSGTIPDQQNGYGTVWTAHSGIQNGSPDGVALVDGSSTVIQFLSYEGSFDATDGAANGMTSTDIGVAEGSADGTFSMQLTGQGANYEDFNWMTDLPATNDAVNSWQVFGTLAEPDNHVTSPAAAALDFSTIEVTWTDATGTNGATGYLVLASSVSYGDITDPVDGTPVADGGMAMNVLPGVEKATFIGLTDNTTYYFKIYAFSNLETDIDYKTDGTIPQADAITPMAGEFILMEDFESGLSWTAISDTGDQVWEQTTSNGANSTASSATINGYLVGPGNQYNVDWLISPPVNLDAYTGETLNFYTEGQYGEQTATNYLKLLYSTDYDGHGMPQEATWNELSFTTGADNVWTKTDDIDISGIAAPTVYFAFKYKSLDNARRWNVDEVVALGTYAGDAVAPVFNSGSPRTDDVRETQFDIVANLNEVGTVFYLVQNDGDPAPTINDVRNADTLEITTANSDFSTTIDTVSTLSAYNIYFVAVDTAGNLQASLTQVDVTTKGPREIDLTSPVGGENYYVGDTVMIEWTSSYIDSIMIWVNIFDGQGWFPLQEEAGTIGADIGSFVLPIPEDAGADSVKMLVADATDFSVNDSSGVFYLTDTINPLIYMLRPENKSANVAIVPDLDIYFNEWVEPGAGDITIHKDDGTPVETIDVTGGQVTSTEYEGYKFSIKPTVKLANQTSYYVLMDKGTFMDYQGNLFGGIVSDTTWNFTTISADIFFSEYIEGSSNNKALEIFNPTGSDVDLASYQIWVASNGTPWDGASTYQLAGTLKADSMFVICNSSANADIMARSDSVGGVLNGTTFFNGDDAVGLYKFVDGNWVLIDAIGEGGIDPGSAWDVAGVTGATGEHTLVRKDFIMTGNPDWASSAGTNSYDSEWKVYPQNYIDNLGLTSPASSMEAEIDTFMLAEETGPATINSSAGTVDIEVVKGTDLSALSPTIHISDYAMVMPASGETVDFSGGSVVYTVTAEDHATTKDWTVTVAEAQVLSSKKKILTFVLDAQTGDAMIDTVAYTVTAEVAYGTDLSSLTPTITVSGGATIDPASGVAQDFSSGAVTYTVTAQDASTQDWAVTVTAVTPVEVSNLAALRASTADNSTLYKVTGEVVVTGFMDYRGRKYLEDGTAAIEIDDADLQAVSTVYSVGDGITGLTGTLENYFGWLEIHPVMDPGAPTSTGNALTPQTITINEFKANFEDYAAELVRIDTVEVTATGNFADGDQIDITRNEDTTIMFVNFYGTDLTGTAIPSMANVTGIAYWHYSEAKIVPRFLADVEEVLPNRTDELPAADPLLIYPNPGSGMFTLEWNNGGISDLEIEILSMNGSLIYRNSYRNVADLREQIDLRNEARGIYLLRIRSSEGISVRKLIIQ